MTSALPESPSAISTVHSLSPSAITESAVHKYLVVAGSFDGKGRLSGILNLDNSFSA
jgi:hypothetical protein